MAYLIGAGCLLAVAALITITGGVRTEIASIRISAQWPTYLCAAAWALLVFGERRSTADSRLRTFLRASVRQTHRGSRGIALMIVACTIVAAVTFGALVAAGADPYGYVSQSVLWANGNPVQMQSSLASQAPWPDAERSFCPLGYKPSVVKGLMVPTYAPGLPLQMAIFARLFGPAGSFLAVPLLGGLAVWATYRFAAEVTRSRMCALISSVLTACSPVFLFQLMQPMSDVPATAWWMFSLVAALEATTIGALGAGCCASLAIITRPNLILLIAPVAAYVVYANPGDTSDRIRRLVLFAVALVPGLTLAGATDQIFFGSPLVSGYGSALDIYTARNAVANLQTYPRWLYTSHSPIVFLGLVPIVAARWLPFSGHSQRARLARHSALAAAFVAALFLSYLFYLPFDHWTYLRFLLPAIPVLIVVAVATIDAVAGAISERVRWSALGFVAMVLPLYYVSFANHGDAFALRRLFTDRYVVAGKRIAAETPKSAIVFGLLQSGSLRVYGERMTVRYDLIPPEWLARVGTFFEQHDRPAYLALEETEQESFETSIGSPNNLGLGSGGRTVDPLGLVKLYAPVTAGRAAAAAR
jgi:hypothetical protein